MTELVWVDAWQFQCCGTPAAVGDTVTWTVTEADEDQLRRMLDPEWLDRVHLAEEHHSDPETLQSITATVRSIRVVRTGHLEWAHAMDPWPPERQQDKHIQLVGWLVALERGVSSP